MIKQMHDKSKVVNNRAVGRPHGKFISGIIKFTINKGLGWSDS